jgi:predicted phosphodiesterase
MRLAPRRRLAPPRAPGWRAVGRALALRALPLVVLALAGALLGLRLAGPLERDTRLGTVSLRVSPSWHGSVEAFIPIADWGVRAHAFRAPVRLHVEPRRADRQAVIAAASGEGAVLEEAEADARDAAHAALLRSLAWAAGGALAAGLLAALVAGAAGRRSPRTLLGWGLGPPLIAVVLGLLVFLRIGATFDVRSFQSPSFFARGEELAQLLKVADKAQGAGEDYRNSVQRTLSGYATLLTAGARFSPVKGEPAAVLASDLHGNTLVLDPLEELFAGRPVFFAGDVGQAGTRAEANALVPRLTGLGRPLVAVSGNHDSSLIMRSLARAGAVVLTDRGRLRPDGRTDREPVQRIAGLRVAGWPDPLEWRGRDPGDSSRVFSFAERPDGDRELREARRDLVAWFDRLSPRPDVVMVHQNALAQALARALASRPDPAPLLILTGHDHKQHVDRYGRVAVVDAGTAGAGGAFGLGTTFVGVARLFYAGKETFPSAVDLVRVEPLSGSAGADRVVLGSKSSCEIERVVCHDED